MFNTKRIKKSFQFLTKQKVLWTNRKYYGKRNRMQIRIIYVPLAYNPIIL